MNERRFARGPASVPERRESPRQASWLAGALALAVAACATTGGGLTADSPKALKERVVAERAGARWQAMIKRDYAGAYQYLSPASRDAVSLANFQARFGSADYKAAAVEKVECAAETCKVVLMLTYDLAPANVRGVVTPLEESWIIDQGNAWFVFRG